MLLYLALYAFLFLGPGMSALRAALAPGAAQDALVLAAKLLVHVALPAALLLLLGAQVRPLFDPGLNRKGFWPALLVLGTYLVALNAVVSPSLGNIATLHPSVPTLIWAVPVFYVLISLEAGLCEEFLYRAVLQSRIAAFLGSAAAAVPVVALLFALAHAPGLYLRGGPGSRRLVGQPARGRRLHHRRAVAGRPLLRHDLVAHPQPAARRPAPRRDRPVAQPAPFPGAFRRAG